MASGILGQAALAADTDTTVYAVPAGALASVNINICNRGDDPAMVRLALATSGTPADGNLIEHNVTLPSGGAIERTGFMLRAGQRVVARSNNASTSVTVQGAERPV